MKRKMEVNNCSNVEDVLRFSSQSGHLPSWKALHRVILNAISSCVSPMFETELEWAQWTRDLTNAARHRDCDLVIDLLIETRERERQFMDQYLERADSDRRAPWVPLDQDF